MLETQPTVAVTRRRYVFSATGVNSGSIELGIFGTAARRDKGVVTAIDHTVVVRVQVGLPASARLRTLG